MTLMSPVTRLKGRAENPDWWRGAVIYQIYPRSFQDSNGDGIGDLRGIIDRLDHVAHLGADAIWISPFFTSPMLDFGYDVSDYRDVDPMFGTLADFDALIARAHALGLKVMIDLVISHSSDRHPWFAESRASRDNPRADWYVWADPKPDGTPPNNWLSIFGGPAWEWDGQREQYYLHNFLREQPDLNLHNPAVQDELLDIVRFWLERGVDGFRLDTINFYFHDPLLRDNPALAPEERNSTIAPSVNPYNWQNHLYDKNQPENLAFLRRFRAVLDEFPGAAVVGEVGDAQRGLEIMAQYTGGGDKVQMCYAFEFLSGQAPGAAGAAEILRVTEAGIGDGWACWAFSNHDVVRHASRWSLPDAGQRAYAALLMSMRGSVCLYQGEELGLPEADVPYERLQDPYGIRFWPKFKGRDGCRTPMPWVAQSEFGGFSTAEPWLPMPAEHLAQAVDTQVGRAGSLFEFYRAMLAFRATLPALAKGDITLLDTAGPVIAYTRAHQGARVLVAINLSDSPQPFAAPAGHWKGCAEAPFDPFDGRVLGPWQAWFATEGGENG